MPVDKDGGEWVIFRFYYRGPRSLESIFSDFTIKRGAQDVSNLLIG